MFATDPIKTAVEYWSEDKDFHYNETMTEEELFEKCKKSYWLPYQFSLYVTSWARYELHLCIRNVSQHQDELQPGGHFADFVYCDTDSVKYIGSGADWTEYNNAKIAASTASGAYAVDAKGKTHYMGVMEREPRYSKFRCCGSKKYAGIIDGKLQLTVAGVNKKLGAEELAARGGIDRLKDGFVFAKAGGLAAKFNDIPEITEFEHNGVKIPITSNEYLYNSPYTMGTMQIYKEIIELSSIDVDRICRLMYNESTAANAE